MNSNLELKLGSQRKWRFRQEGRDVKEVIELVDRISDLPDHIIAQILSFLDTQIAITTSILSSRWRYLWKGITHISLGIYNVHDPENFSNLVEQVLQNCSSTNFLAFELSCPVSTDSSRLNAWISCIHSHQIEKLSICANNSDDYLLPSTPLPQCILSFTTLVDLKLDCFDIQIPESIVSFPCLKSLDLHVIPPNSEDVVNQLLSCCPVLEKLCLFGFLDSLEVLKIDISVSTLTKLNLQLRSAGYSYSKKHAIVINTPNLDYLSIDDDSFARYVVKNLAWVSNVFVNYEAISLGFLVPEYINCLLELFKGIAATELLTLHWNTVDVLGSALHYTWPTFPYLMTLIVHLSSFSGWTCFSKVLHSAPSLEVLVLDLEGINDVDDRPSGDDDNDLYHWTPPDRVPTCLSDHLEIIGIQYFEGNKDEVQIVEYLLSNAQVLERMMIGYDPEFMSDEVREKILTCPRASKTCDVEIYGRCGFKTDLTTSLTKITLWGL